MIEGHSFGSQFCCIYVLKSKAEPNIKKINSRDDFFDGREEYFLFDFSVCGASHYNGW